MKINEIANKINKIIEESGYSKKYVLEFINAENELDPDTVMALSAAYDFMTYYNADPKLIARLHDKYLAGLNDLKEYYSRR